MSDMSVDSRRSWRRHTQFAIQNYAGDPIYCYCHAKAVMWVCWREGNVGRRFLKCAKRKCKYFTWFDEELCQRSVDVIQSLLDNEEKLQCEIISIKEHVVSLQDVNVSNLIELQHLSDKLDEALLGKSSAFRKDIIVGVFCVFLYFLLLILFCT